jgi:DNA recombination protein RmuC
MEVWVILIVGTAMLGLGVLLGYLVAIARGQSARDQTSLQLASLQAERRADLEKLAWMQDSEVKLREAFDSLAARSLQVTSEELLRRARDQSEAAIRQMEGDLATNRAQLQGVVEPLQTNLKAIDAQLREMEQRREGAYQGLREQVSHLAAAHASLQTTTLTLAQALKSQSVRGRWGEVTLRRVVEMAQMTPHVDFTEQVAGDAGRPDMVIHLSNEGELPVDAKVPLNAYLEAIEAPDDETRRRKLAEHARAMRARMRELGARGYWNQFERTPDFVVMFVPNEACLAAAFESDPALLDDAISQHVIVASPVTLLALLKAVAFGWQQALVAENARTIAQQGQDLYKRLETFVQHLTELGRSLNRSAEDYNRVIGSLERRLMPAARRLQESGLAASSMDSPETIDVRAQLPGPADVAPDE